MERVHQAPHSNGLSAEDRCHIDCLFSRLWRRPQIQLRCGGGVKGHKVPEILNAGPACEGTDSSLSISPFKMSQVPHTSQVTLPETSLWANRKCLLIACIVATANTQYGQFIGKESTWSDTLLKPSQCQASIVLRSALFRRCQASSKYSASQIQVARLAMALTWVLTR